MALGGLWHGAGLTFVAWGAAHGVALGLHLVWRKAGRTMPDGLGFVLTFAFVALAWVLFRAPSFAAALAIYEGLVGLAPLGTRLSWPMLAVAAAVATLGPTSWSLVRRLPPSRWVAVAAAILAAAVLLRGGQRYQRRVHLCPVLSRPPPGAARRAKPPGAACWPWRRSRSP